MMGADFYYKSQISPKKINKYKNIALPIPGVQPQQIKLPKIRSTCLDSYHDKEIP